MLKNTTRHRRCYLALRLLLTEHLNDAPSRAASNKWSSGIDIDAEADVQLNMKRATKKRNWEAKKQFGPLRPRPATDTTKDTDPHKSPPPLDWFTSAVQPLVTTTTTTTIRIRESGYSPQLDDWQPCVDTNRSVTVTDDIEHLVASGVLNLTRVNATAMSPPALTASRPVSVATYRRLQPNAKPATIAATSRKVVASTRKIASAVTLPEPTAEPGDSQLLLLPPVQRLCRFPMTVTDGDADIRTDVERCLEQLWTARGSVVSEPSVSRVLQQSMSAESVALLERWKTQMVALLGIDGFADYQKETFAVGTELHQSIARHIGGQPIAEEDVDRRIAAHWKSLKQVLPDISNVILQEQRVRHPVLRYRGVFDCVAKYRGTTVLIEWKTSQKQKGQLQFTYDNPLQIAAYIGALNLSEQLDYQISRAAIVIAYSDGSPAHVHFLNEELCRKYWVIWLQRFHKFLTLAA